MEKIIEAMRKIKDNEIKIKDLQLKIANFSAYIDVHPTEYKDETKNVVTGWVQSCVDLTQENASMHLSIMKTNLATNVTISINGKDVTKSIAEWVLRRRIYAEIDLTTYSRLTDKNLKSQAYQVNNPNTGQQENGWTKIILSYDPQIRDAKIAEYRSEPSLINSALEIVNATTDLI